MRIVGSLCVLLCGVAVVVGVFLPWWDELGVTVSGWDGIEASIPDALEPFLALVGGAVMVICALLAFIVSLATRGGKAALLTLSLLATLATSVAIGGTAWFIVEAATDPLVEISIVGSGFYISIGMAVLGLIFAIIMLAGSVVEHTHR